jgi:hypothetical protein
VVPAVWFEQTTYRLQDGSFWKHHRIPCNGTKRENQGDLPRQNSIFSSGAFHVMASCFQ